MSIQYVRTKELLEAEVDEEIVALDPAAGQCYGFNMVSAEIWRLLASPIDLETLHRMMLEKFDIDEQQCRSELLEHLGELEGHGLIRRLNADLEQPVA